MTAKSTRTVQAALIGNALVAATKFIAAALSGSASMLTEAVHSTTDTANQILLLFGNRRSAQHSDRSHNFGYGMEIYYWTFVVAIMILFSGGIFSVYMGWSRILHPQPVHTVWLSLTVLGLSALFEGASFAVGYRQYRALVAEYDVPKSAANLWTFIKVTKDPNLYETLLEDGAALIGLALAAARSPYSMGRRSGLRRDRLFVDRRLSHCASSYAQPDGGRGGEPHDPQAN